MLPPQFLYHRGLRACDSLLTLFHRLQVASDRGMEERLVQLDFDVGAAFLYYVYFFRMPYSLSFMYHLFLCFVSLFFLYQIRVIYNVCISNPCSSSCLPLLIVLANVHLN